MYCHGRHEWAGRHGKYRMILMFGAWLLAFSAQAGWFWGHSAAKIPSRQANVWRLQDEMALNLRRVVILPLTVAQGAQVDEDSRHMLESALRQELLRSRQFEVLTISSTRLQVLVGRPRYRAEEELPAELFRVMKQEFDADLVLFVEVTQFSPYAPMQLGWRLKLVGVEPTITWWQADESFSMEEEAVSKRVKSFLKDRIQRSPALDASWLAERSPRGFAEYSAEALLATLPQRTRPD